MGSRENKLFHILSIADDARPHRKKGRKVSFSVPQILSQYDSKQLSAFLTAGHNSAVGLVQGDLLSRLYLSVRGFVPWSFLGLYRNQILRYRDCGQGRRKYCQTKINGHCGVMTIDFGLAIFSTPVRRKDTKFNPVKQIAGLWWSDLMITQEKK